MNGTADIIRQWLKANSRLCTEVYGSYNSTIRFWVHTEENEIEINLEKTFNNYTLLDHEVELVIAIPQSFTCNECNRLDRTEFDCYEDCDQYCEVKSSIKVSLADPDCFYIMDEVIDKGLLAEVDWKYLKGMPRNP